MISIHAAVTTIKSSQFLYDDDDAGDGFPEFLRAAVDLKEKLVASNQEFKFKTISNDLYAYLVEAINIMYLDSGFLNFHPSSVPFSRVSKPNHGPYNSD